MMKKLQNKAQEAMKDNKGFSLVELIIVIAIMAILIGIVGMNVIPQINNARKATDAQVLSAMVSEAMEVYTQVAQGEGGYTINVTLGSSTVTVTADTGATAPSVDMSSQMADAYEELAKPENRVMKSDAGKALSPIVIKCTEADGVYIGTVSGGTYTPPTDFDGYEFRSR